MDFVREMEEARRMVEARLGDFFPGPGLAEAMRYSLLAGGKRIRPILTVKFCEAAGGTMAEALDFGCGVEMLHTYSLIHDDLPCMDDDDLRRGKPTCHKAFGECAATLAGDALQAAAFQTVLSAESVGSPGIWLCKGMAANILAEAAGLSGMCGGQYQDTLGDGGPRTLEELTEINARKTGALLRAACMMGVAAAMIHQNVEDTCMDAAMEYADNLGQAFQIRDDMLDVTSTDEAFGKSVGSDAANHKTTYVTLLGVEECGRRVQEYTELAKNALRKASWPGGTDFLTALADSLAQREN